MKRVLLVVVTLGAIAASAGGCYYGSAGPGHRQASAPATRIEVTYLAAMRRQCAAGTRCVELPLRRIACPPGSRCVPPAAHAELVRCPGRSQPGLHCWAARESGLRGPWLILQRRDLSCSPAQGGYADPAAACRAFADFLRRSHGHVRTCMCPLQLWGSVATGTFRGRRVNVDVSACAACGLGRAANADRALLTPALGA